MINKKLNEELKEMLIRELSASPTAKQLSHWRGIANKLIGKKLFVLWVNSRSIQKSEIVIVDSVTNHFMVCHKNILGESGENHYTVPVTIAYTGLISNSVYIELLDEEV